MKRYTRRQIFITLILLALTTLSVVLIETLNRHQQAFIRDRLQERAREELSHVRAQLEASVMSDIYILTALTTLVSVLPDHDVHLWAQLTRQIKHQSRHIRVIGLAPNDIVKFVYPERGNEKVLGLDYRSVPAQWRSVQQARELERILISGPVDLVQGGRSLIVRIPIFTDAPKNQQYWGVCSAVLSLGTLFLDAGVELMSHRFDIAVRGGDALGQEGEIFFGDPQTFAQAFATETVYFPYGSWMIAAAVKKDELSQLPWNHRYLVRVMGYLILAMVLATCYFVFRLYQVADERALHDDLTSLPNRRYFMFSLEKQFSELEASADTNNSFGILNMDVDKFKYINDFYGHAAGDKVLIACAQRIKGVLRSSDLVARMGGDEFLALLPRITDYQELDQICQKVREAIEHTPVIYQQHIIDVKVSIGCVLYREHFENVEALLHAADDRMYSEKNEKNAQSSSKSNL